MRLGASDLAVSRVGLGCNNFGRRLDAARTREVVDAAVEAGATFFDTADIYGLGRARSSSAGRSPAAATGSCWRRSSATTCRARTATRPAAHAQNHYSLLSRDDDADVLPRCREHGIGYVPYFPLESGLLTGKYRRGEPAPVGSRLDGAGDDRLGDDRLRQVEALEAFAAGCGHTLLELAIGGLASVPGIASVIAGATSARQVRSNAAAGTWQLTPAELEQLASVANNV